jgi:lactate racemase
MGMRSASTFADALELARDTVGASPSITYLHSPPHILANVT